MSKGKRNAGSGGTPLSPSSSVGRRIGVRKTFIERLLAKADSMFSMGTDLAQMLQDRRAPGEVSGKALEFIPVLEKYREMFFGLRDSGWVPAEKSLKKDFQEGDRVMIVKDHIPRYEYIPGLSEGTTQLVAAKFIPRGGKYVDVLVKDAATGAAYGLVPKGQLVGA